MWLLPSRSMVPAQAVFRDERPGQWGRCRLVRSQFDAESGFRQLKNPHVASFAPMHRWTDHNIPIHTFTCVLDLQIGHLMRRDAKQAGEHHSMGELPERLSSFQETVMTYPSTGGRPKARRMLTGETDTHAKLTEICSLAELAPQKSWVIHFRVLRTTTDQTRNGSRSGWPENSR